MELREALAQITEIRAQIAQNETFRGYRSLTVGLTGLAALLVLVPRQSGFLRRKTTWRPTWRCGLALPREVWPSTDWRSPCDPTGTPGQWLGRPRGWPSSSLSPSVAAGGLLSAAIVFEAPEYMRMLPGLWSIVFGLGIFASCRLLPSPTFWLAVYYLVGGVAILAFVRGDAAFSPWIMAGTFGVGQSLAAAILYFTLERRHDKT